MNDIKTLYFKLITNFDEPKDKLPKFLRSKDYYIYNLLNKKGKQKSDIQPELIELNPKNHNINGFPSINIKKVIKIKEKNGTFRFKKIDYNFQNKKKNKELDKDNTISYIYNQKKALIKNNSCHLFSRNNKLYETNHIIDNPLIITHINRLKINKNNNKLIKFKKNFSYRHIDKSENRKLIENSVNKRNDYNINIYKKNEGTQINIYNSIYNKRRNIFLNGRNNNINNKRKSYCSPGSIIFETKIQKLFYRKY